MSKKLAVLMVILVACVSGLVFAQSAMNAEGMAPKAVEMMNNAMMDNAMMNEEMNEMMNEEAAEVPAAGSAY